MGEVLNANKGGGGGVADEWVGWLTRFGSIWMIVCHVP